MEQPTQGSGALARVRILDLSNFGMGPYATALMAELGASVVKVEPNEGDPTRNNGAMRHPGMSSAFLLANRNKRVAASMAAHTTAEWMLRLVAADIPAMPMNTLESLLDDHICGRPASSVGRNIRARAAFAACSRRRGRRSTTRRFEGIMCDQTETSDSPDEQLMLRDAVRQFVRKEVPDAYARRCDREKIAPLDAFDKMAPLGWLGVAIPEEYGGSGLAMKRLLRNCTLLFLALLAGTFPAWAQNYQIKPIRMVLGAGAGGATDVIARAMAQKLSERLGQPVVVDNRPGANGVIGADAAAKAVPDGYSIILGSVSTHGSNPSFYARPAIRCGMSRQSPWWGKLLTSFWCSPRFRPIR